MSPFGLAFLGIEVLVYKALSKDKWIKLDQLCEQKYLKSWLPNLINSSLQKVFKKNLKKKFLAK